MSTQPSEEKLNLERALRLLLPAKVTPLVIPEKRAIAFLSWESDSPLGDIALFTPMEWTVLLTLAEFYPQYGSYEVLLAKLIATSADYSRQLIQEAQQRKALPQAVGPIRDAVKKLRVKLRPFALTVSPLYGLGYFLAAVSSQAHN